MFLDSEIESVGQLATLLPEAIAARYELQDAEAELAQALAFETEAGPQVLDHSTAVYHARCDLPVCVQVFVRFREPLPLRDRQGNKVQFAWVLLSDQTSHPHLDLVAEFVHLMGDPDFLAAAQRVAQSEDIWQAYDQALHRELSLARLPAGLEPTGRIFGGLIADLKRRLPLYGSDFRDGFCSKALASILFLFFAVLAPTTAFGGLLSVLTKGEIGVVETLLATSVVGVLYALFSGQPLNIVGSTGPIIIFLGILYDLCQMVGAPYLPTLAWVGLWTALFLVLLTAFDASSWVRFFTRFTDDTFAGLIAIIFIFEAVKDMVHVFTDHKVSHDTALLSLILAIGTFWIATNLSRFRRSVYLRRAAREFLADFGPAIAIAAMTGVAVWLHQVELQTLQVPSTLVTTSGRAWLVNPFDAPRWVWLASALPAVLAAILVYLDHNITARLVNTPDHKLKKHGGYHLDLAVVALLIAGCSLFGLPWLVAATVRSLNHVRSLANVEGEGNRIVSVVETRVTGLMVHAMIGCSLLVLPLLQLVPMPVLFGLFLYMGVASLGGNQLFERLTLWVMDPSHYPPTHYLRAVPLRVVHRYTLIQALCLAALWTVKASAVAIVFPLLIALLVPVRMSLDRFFKKEHIALLDLEEEPASEAFREAMPG
ncbi:MAG: PTS sugar transporter subunit IIA [Vulcanimicrobiota bacterium]